MGYCNEDPKPSFQVQKSRIPISKNLSKPDEWIKTQVAFCIIMGIVIYICSCQLPGIWQILFKWIDILMVLGTIALICLDSIEDQPPKSRVSTVLSNEACSAKEVELFKKQLAKNPPGKPGGMEAIQLQKSCIPISQNLRKPDKINNSAKDVELFKKQLAKNPPGKPGGREAIQVQKSCIAVSQNPRKPDRITKKQVAICITMGIFVYSYGYLLPGLSQILFNCIGFYVVLISLAARQEDSEMNQTLEKKPVDKTEHRKVLDRPVLPEPDKAPVLEEKMDWSEAILLVKQLLYFLEAIEK